MSGPGSIMAPRSMLAPRRLFFFEKWYFDGHTPEGDFFLVYFAPVTLLGQVSAELVICLFPADGGSYRRSINIRGGLFTRSADRCSASFPGGAFHLAPGSVRFGIAREGVEVDLHYAPTDPSWTPFGDGILLRDGGRSLRWVVPMPRAALKGRVKLGNREVDFDGFGYSDFVQTDIPPWRLPLRTLLWGRALGPDFLLIWNRATFASRGGARHVSQSLLRTGDGPAEVFEVLTPSFDRWQPDGRTGDRYPVEMGLAFTCSCAASARVALDETRLLLGDYVTDVQEFRSELERKLYGLFTGNPIEYKLLAGVSLAGSRQKALAAHELVRWGRRR